MIYDPWRFGQAAQELERERVTVTAFPQTDTRMIPASDRLYRAVVDKRLTVPDDDELRVQVNTIARHSRRGSRLDKPTAADALPGVQQPQGREPGFVKPRAV